MTISNVSSGLRPGVCTSSTRPSAPYEGQMVYETDTDKVLVWNGSLWTPPWNTSWGTIAISTLSNGASPAGNPAAITSITFSHVPNRRVLISAYGRLSFSGSTNSAIELRDGSSQILYWDYPVQSYWSGTIQTIQPSSASSKTYDVRLWQGGTQTLNVYYSFTLSAVDLGPA